MRAGDNTANDLPNLRCRGSRLVALILFHSLPFVAVQALPAETTLLSVSGAELEFVWVPVDAPEGVKSVEVGDFSGRHPKEKKRTESIYAPFERDGKRGYYLGKTEVTEEQWLAVMGEGPRSKLPVTGKTYAEVQSFLEKLNTLLRESGDIPRTPDGASGVLKLPTEGEWEYAARGAEGSRYKEQDPHGGDLERYEVFSLPGSKRTSREVASLPPNSLGLHDMLGNVREFIEGSYSVGGIAGGGLLLKGGSYLSERNELRSSTRAEHQRLENDGRPNRRPDAGLRLCISAEIFTSLGSKVPLSPETSLQEGSAFANNLFPPNEDQNERTVSGLSQPTLSGGTNRARAEQTGSLGNNSPEMAPPLPDVQISAAQSWLERLKLLEKASATDDPRAAGVLAFLCAMGVADGVNANAYALANKSFEAGNTFGQLALAVIYQTGSGAQKDPDKARLLFTSCFHDLEKLSNDGDEFASLALASMLREGRFVPKNTEAAYTSLNRLAANGNPVAQNWLALALANGDGVEEDREAAKSLLFSAAEQGHAWAQFNLAEFLDSENDPVGLLKWIRAAAQGGVPAAQNRYGVMLEAGRGVAQNEGEAAKWFTRAAQGGDPWGQFNLAAMYAEGRGVPRDFRRAAQLFRQSAHQGIPAAQNRYGVMLEAGRGVAQNQGEAAKWFTRAAQGGDAWGQFNLGKMRLDGRIVARDQSAAAQLFRLAANQGNASAQHLLGTMLLDGVGVSQDKVEGIRLLELSAAAGVEAAAERLRSLRLAEAQGPSPAPAESGDFSLPPLEIFEQQRVLIFPQGYTVHNDAGAVIKTVPGPAELTCVGIARDKAFAPQGAYLSDWSYERMQKGEKPNWVAGEVSGVEAPAPQNQQASPRYLAIETSRSKTTPAGAVLVMIYDAQQRSLVGNTVYNLASRPKIGDVVQCGPFSAVYAGGEDVISDSRPTGLVVSVTDSPPPKKQQPRDAGEDAQFFPDMVVLTDKTPVFRLGPRQAEGADVYLRKGDKVMLLRKEFGYSRVKLENGLVGYMANQDMAPALASSAPSAQTAPKPPQGPFYRPADKFPKNVSGLKIVGRFVVSGSLDLNSLGSGELRYLPPYYLEADSDSGEKNKSRWFYPKNKNVTLGERYTFTEDSPLTVIKKISFTGNYDVLFPEN
jgi:TPR repeat protein/formylglycine-generating enzyme required for sulfatase activity